MSPSQLQELQPIAEALNTESNEINTTIAAPNGKLAVLNVGLEVWLLPDEDHYQIGYAKIDDKWQLATRHCARIRWVPDQNMVNMGFSAQDYGDRESERGTSYEVTPLLQGSRQLRIRALDYAHVLVEELKDAAEESLKSIRAAKKLAA